MPKTTTHARPKTEADDLDERLAQLERTCADVLQTTRDIAARVKAARKAAEAGR